MYGLKFKIFDSNVMVCQTYWKYNLYMTRHFTANASTSQYQYPIPDHTKPPSGQLSMYLVYCPCPRSPLWWFPDPGCPSSAWRQSTPLPDSLLLHHCKQAVKTQTQQSIKIWNYWWNIICLSCWWLQRQCMSHLSFYLLSKASMFNFLHCPSSVKQFFYVFL